jgi:hypothetical protein
MKKAELLKRLGEVSNNTANLLGDSNLLNIVKDIENIQEEVDEIISLIEEDGIEADEKEK